MLNITNIVILIMIIYVYSFKLSHPDFKIVTYDEIEHKAKSGDLILFASLDSANQLFMGSYYTHIGVVYRKDPDAIPVLIESFNNFRMQIYPEEFSSGIAICDLKTRFDTYRGFILYKELANSISEHANEDFIDFIKYAKKNIKYDYNVISNEIGKILLNTPFTNKTNCGQFTTMILMKLNLIDFSNFEDRQKHHLRFCCGLTKLKNRNYYKEPVYVYQKYFKPINLNFEKCLTDPLE